MKKNGKRRFCVDYRKLNAVTKRDNYPLPRIDELFDSLGGSKWFSSLDLASGYWQVEVEPEDREKTAFITKHGVYEFRVMPFGLSNAPGTFQRLMDKVFKEEIGKNIVVYLDDINIYSKTFEEHLVHLRQAFDKLRAAGLKLGADKCHFCRQSLEFLGHIISAEGIAPDPAKIEKVQQWPTPSNITELRGFLGLASYYRCFIKDFAQVAAPLYQLLKKNAEFKIEQTQQQALDNLKTRLTTAPILQYPDFSKSFILHTDASFQGLGAILSQKDSRGKEFAIYFASRTLSTAEKNYSVTELEALAVIWAVKKFRPYLLYSEFTLVTDHIALKGLFNNPNPIGRIARWIATLQQYHYTIEYRQGKSHNNADALSRLPKQQ
jgi:hypothetical protein